MRRDSSETKRKILTVCVRLFLEQGYKDTSVSQIVEEAGVARGITDKKLPPVYAYAVETAIQLTQPLSDSGDAGISGARDGTGKGACFYSVAGYQGNFNRSHV